MMTQNSIQSLEDLLQYAVNQIDKNVSVDLILLKLHLEYSEHISLPKWKGWKGRVWAFFSSDPRPTRGVEDPFSFSLITRTSEIGYGLHSISAIIMQDIGHPPDLPLNRTNRHTYKGYDIYPVTYACNVALDALPGYKTLQLITREEPELYKKLLYINPKYRRHRNEAESS